MKIILLEVLFLFLFASNVFAVSIQLSNVPTAITTDEFTINAAISGAAASSTNYLRAAFYTDSNPTNYFGYTYNGSAFYNGTPSPIDPHQFLSVSIDSQGSWSGQLKVKIDPSSTAFVGTDNYYLKIGRYTASATSVSNWSDGTLVSVVAPSPTPTPTPGPTATTAPIVQNTVAQKVSVTTPLPQVTKKPTIAITPNFFFSKDSTDSGEVLSDSTSSADTTFDEQNKSPTPTFPMKLLSQKTSFNWPFFLGILILASVCGILSFRFWEKRKRIGIRD